MLSIRITAADGSAWTQSLTSALVNVGRAESNDLILDDPAVSSQHCLVEFDGYNYVVKDRGSANGTFMNNVPLAEPTVFREGDRVYVGPFLIELVSMAPQAMTRVGLPPRRMGPLIRDAEARSGGVQREQERLRRWAVEWDAEGRPARLLMRPRALRGALELMGRADSPAATNPLVRDFVARSKRHASMRKTLRIGAALLSIVVVGGALGGGYYWWQTRPQHGADPEPEEAAAPTAAPAVSAPAPSEAPADEWIEHSVIPAETLEDIARRYDVPLTSLARWNRLNPDAPDIEVGRKLQVKPNLRPLPQQEIAFEVDQKSDWRSMAERFDVQVGKLRDYNPGIEELVPGTVITVWIDPKPHAQRELGKIPIFDVRPDAFSIGRPNDGHLENGIQLPKSDLYVRRAPSIQWGSSHTIETLLTAVARFRQEVNFDGVVVLSDISRKHGGNFFPPHKSHQAGRDIDIWMPTLKGVYKRSYLGKERKPKPGEIDWFATWGLVRALIQTDQIVHIFLTYELQEKLYHAAELMGATPEELERNIQYPRGPRASGIVGHSPGHDGHIHVRFKCGPNDHQCINDVSRDP